MAKFRGLFHRRADAVTGDLWHRRTDPPRVADSAEWYAYDLLALPFYSVYGDGVVTYRNFELPGQVSDTFFQSGPRHGIDGVLAGDPRTTSLLLAQADAAARGLAAVTGG